MDVPELDRGVSESLLAIEREKRRQANVINDDKLYDRVHVQACWVHRKSISAEPGVMHTVHPHGGCWSRTFRETLGGRWALRLKEPQGPGQVRELMVTWCKWRRIWERGGSCRAFWAMCA